MVKEKERELMYVRKFYIKRLGAITVMLLLLGVIYGIVSGAIERWVYDRGVALLSSRLGTVVTLDSVDVSLSRREVSLYGFTIEDRQHSDMLSVDTMCVKVAIMPLLRSNVVVDHAMLRGVNVQLYKERRDTSTNFQFVLDVLKKKKIAVAHDEDKEKRTAWDVSLRTITLERAMIKWDVRSEAKKGAGRFDANHLYLRNVTFAKGAVQKTEDSLQVVVNALRADEINSGMSLRLSLADYRKWHKDSVMLCMSHVNCTYKDMQFGCKTIAARQQRGSLSAKYPMLLNADSLTFVRNNGKPHKRTGKPHRGYFDVGHVNAVMNIDVMLRCATADSTVAEIKRLSVYDKMSGIDIRSFLATFKMRKDTIALYDMNMRLPHSLMVVKEIQGVLLRNAVGKANDVRISPFLMTSRIVLRDIAKPFAPVLSDFTTPLNLSVVTDGTLLQMNFKNIYVTTPDKRLSLTAWGKMQDVTKRYDLRLDFNNIRLVACRGIKEIIVGHFSHKVRMKMNSQMQKIGDIRYRGTLAIAFRREDIAGTLFTNYGNADFAFTIDGRSKQMTGVISSEAFEVGKVMNVNGLGTMKARAAYSFNVASRTHRTDRTKGRLPIGWLRATVDSTRFKSISFRNVSTVMHSDGTTAIGEIMMPKKLFDISVQFWYTQTDSAQTLRFKPKLTRRKREPLMFGHVKKWKDYMDEARRKAYSKRISK